MRRLLYSTFVAVIGLTAAYGIGILCDFEYPYWRLLSKVKSADTSDGQSALDVVSSIMRVPVGDLHVHTCNYCVNQLASYSKDLAHVQVHVEGRPDRYHFAFNNERNELAPITQASIEKFEAMVSKDTVFSVTDIQIGGEAIKLPAHWIKFPREGERDIQNSSVSSVSSVASPPSRRRDRTLTLPFPGIPGEGQKASADEKAARRNSLIPPPSSFRLLPVPFPP